MRQFDNHRGLCQSKESECTYNILPVAWSASGPGFEAELKSGFVPGAALSAGEASSHHLYAMSSAADQATSPQ